MTDSWIYRLSGLGLATLAIIIRLMNPDASFENIIIVLLIALICIVYSIAKTIENIADKEI